MLGIGMPEMILIAGLALVLLGPEKFPVFAKVVLHAIRDIRGYWDEIKKDVTEELKPFKKELKELSRYNPEDYIESLGVAIASEKKSDEQPSDEAKTVSDPEASVAHATERAEADVSAPATPEGAVPHETKPPSTVDENATD